MVAMFEALQEQEAEDLEGLDEEDFEDEEEDDDEEEEQ